MFSQLIKPICLYGSEIWGIDEIKWKDTNTFVKSAETLAAEKLQLSFSKFALGVHKKAQNSAVRGELGCFPLGLDIVANTLLYYFNVKYASDNILLNEAYEVSKKCGQKSWACKIDSLTTYLKNVNHEKPVIISDRKQIQHILRTLYIDHWQMHIKTESKMRTYIKFKSNFQYEKYLDDLTRQHRTSFTRFRISAHNLAIERGRYERPPIPAELRLCPYCPLSVQDEYHFLLECSEYEEHRKQLLTNIVAICPNFTHLSNINKFTFLLNAEGLVVKELAAFIHRYLT